MDWFSEELCVVTYTLGYVETTSALRQGTSQLLLSFEKPSGPISADTVSNWIKHVLSKSGINTSLLSARSIRSASSASAKQHRYLWIPDRGYVPTIIHHFIYCTSVPSTISCDYSLIWKLTSQVRALSHVSSLLPTNDSLNCNQSLA